MNKYFRTVAVFACIGSIGIGSAQVSAAEHTNASIKPPKLKTGVTITITDFFDSAKKDDPGRLVMEKVAQDWAAHTHNHVKFNGHPNNSQNQLCTDAPAGNGEDIIGSPHDQLSVMTQCDALAPVPNWAFTPAMQKGYVTAALQGVRINGKYIAMPWAIETSGLFYNKALISPSLFKTSGKKPLSWKKLLPKLKALTDPGAGKYGLGWKLDDFYFNYGTVSAFGGYVFKYTKKGFDYHSIGLDNAGAIKGYQFIKDMTTNGKYGLVPSSFTGNNGYSQMESLFDAGKLAVWLTGPWAEENMTKGGVNFGFAPMPSPDGVHPAHQFSGVQAYAVNAFSKNKNEAFALLSYMTRKMQLPEFKKQGRIPVLKSVLKESAVRSNPVARGLAAAVTAARPMPNIPEMGKVWDPMSNALTLVVKGQASPTKAAHDAVTKIKQDIAKLHGA